MTIPTLPTTMRALQQTSFQGTKDLRLIDAPVPTPGAGEVLIRVAAAGINFADISRAGGTFRNGPVPPFLAGFEAAGEIVGLGTGVKRPTLGAHVVGVGAGAFAEYMVLRAVAALPIPPGWTAAQALGLAVNWPTALAALKALGRLEAGETVLIHAGAGATGQAALKLAKHYGARVIAACARAKHDTVRALGADHVLDSGAAELAAEVLSLTNGGGADLVLESAGGATFSASLAAAKRVTGRVVVLGLAGGEAQVSNWQLVYEHPVQLIGLNLGALIEAAPHTFGQLMGEVASLVAAGVVGPVHPTTYALADGQRALADLQARVTVGKLALLP